MANNLNVELKGKTVIARGRKFLCKDGFGCSSMTNGSKIYGIFLDDIRYDKNKKEIWDVISGYEVSELID